MNDIMWVIPYVILFFLIFIPTTLFLFSSDHLKSILNTVTMVSFSSEYKDPLSTTKSVPNDPVSCVNDLFNKFQSGMLDPSALLEGIDRCFSLRLNPNDGDNNSQIIPGPGPGPGPPTANKPRFV